MSKTIESGSTARGTDFLCDRYGNTVSTPHRKALDLYDQAAAQFSSYRIDPIATIDAALAEDPAFVMGHCFKAGLLATTTERGAERDISVAIDAAERNAATATVRERQHIAAARAWLRRDFAEAVRRYGEIVVDHPRDLFALQIAHLGDFFLGQSSMLRDRPAQVLPAWTATEDGYGYILGMHAFGLEECGDYAAAEADGRRAVELDSTDAWAVHAVTHVHEMRGHTAEGCRWLESTSAGWNTDNFFAFHNWWHKALFHLDTGQVQNALALYDAHIRPTQSRVPLEMIDASALLWRLRLRDVDVGQRWQALAECWACFGETGHYAFNDVHAVMAFSAAGNHDAENEVMRALEDAARGPDTNGMMSREVGLPVARAITAFAHGAFDQCIEELTRVRAIANRFGGSHAQRDLLNLTLCEAAQRSGRTDLVKALVAEKLALKPHSPFYQRVQQRAASDASQTKMRAA